MKADRIVEEGRRVREELVKKHGGLEGWIEHLQQMDEARASKAKSKKKPIAKRKSVPRTGKAKC